MGTAWHTQILSNCPVPKNKKKLPRSKASGAVAAFCLIDSPKFDRSCGPQGEGMENIQPKNPNLQNENPNSKNPYSKFIQIPNSIFQKIPNP